MSRLSSKIYKRISFNRSKYIETVEELVNPYRGWYQIHTFKLEENFTMADREYTLNATDTLALILVDIGTYKDRPLDKHALDNLDMIFEFFRDYRLDMIVRVVYDSVGNCMETEPQEEQQIAEHMSQLVPIIKKYKENIFVYQGLLIGNWGEMHSSKFLTPSRLRRLSEVFLGELEDVTYLAVRRPAYIRILFPEGEDLKQTKIGIFDDAILASPTHLGTFGEQPAKEVRREQSWLPKEELAYVSALCDRVPYGGEGLHNAETDEISNIRNSLKDMASYLSNLHVTYLNRIHDANFIEHIKTLKWNGRGIFKNMDGYTYLSRHLGYRFVLRNVKCGFVESDKSIMRWDITIENVGFARSFFKNGCEMQAYDQFGNEVNINISEWINLDQIASKTTHTFVVMTPVVKGDVFISFTKEDTKQAVYFANKNKKEGKTGSEIFLGTVKHNG